MKKLFSLLITLTLFISINLKANENLTKKAIDTAKKTTILDNTWTVYASNPYIVNKDNSINYKALNSNFDAQKISVSVWVKNDNTKSALYIFLQSPAGYYADNLIVSNSSVAKNGVFKKTYKDNMGKFTVEATKEKQEFINVYITTGQEDLFIKKGVFYKK